jgi:flagellar biosynthetic protein FliQ
MPEAIDLARGALFMVLFIAGPILLFGVLVGLCIALFQAVTSLQEQTLQFVPKIFAMALATSLLIPYLSVRLLNYAAELFGSPPL